MQARSGPLPTTFFRLALLAAFAVGLLLITGQGVSRAAVGITNGDFETGDFTGWTTVVPAGAAAEVVQNDTGYNQNDGSNFYGPPSGDYYALIKTDGPGSFTTLEQSFTALEDDVVKGCAFFRAGDYLPFNDEMQVFIIDSTGAVIDTPFNESVSTVGNYGETGWTYWESILPADGTYTVQARIANSGDSGVDSYGGLDAVSSASTELCPQGDIVPPPGSIAGTKYADNNGDGNVDIGDLPLSGVDICLIEGWNGGGGGEEVFLNSFAISNSIDPADCYMTDTTDANGDYLFEDVPAGLWTVAEILPPGSIQTYPSFGEPHFVDLGAGQGLFGFDFLNAPGAELSVLKFGDENANGAQDGSEVALPGFEICVREFTPPATIGGIFDCDVTGFDDPGTLGIDETGMVFFDLPAGWWVVEEGSNFGWSQTFPAGGLPHYVNLAEGSSVNVKFGNYQAPPGRIEGYKFSDLDGDGVWDAGEPPVQGVTIGLSPSGWLTQTDAAGYYSFEDVPVGQYTVTEYLTGVAVPTNGTYRAVSVTAGNTTVAAPFGNKSPVPPPAEITVGPLNQWSNSGLPTVYWQNPITFTKDVTDHCGADSPVQVTVQIIPETGGPFVQAASNPSGEIWTATFPPFYPAHGYTQIKYWVDCPGDTPNFPNDLTDSDNNGLPDSMSGEDELQDGGSIYIDPSGNVVDALTGAPIAGAEVTLLAEYPAGSGIFLPADDVAALVGVPTLSIPLGDSQSTPADGSFGWVVVAGKYKLSVSAPNCYPYLTPDDEVYDIPPAVTDLEIELTCEHLFTDIVDVTGFDTSYSADPNASHPDESPAGVMTIEVTWLNSSGHDIFDIVGVVSALTNGNWLLNADGGPGQVGASLSPAAGAFGGDNVWSDGESFSFVFEVGLMEKSQFFFGVDGYGYVGTAP